MFGRNCSMFLKLLAPDSVVIARGTRDRSVNVSCFYRHLCGIFSDFKDFTSIKYSRHSFNLFYFKFCL